jgi:arylsulfatase A-like enzyme/Tfp pilus assembly protein PilF
MLGATNRVRGSRGARCGPTLAVALTLACAGGPRAERVVLVTLDTVRADAVGCYGARQAHTATLDALAARGVRFETAVSPAPLTLPSHASLLTGLAPPRHGARSNSTFRLPDDVPTLAENLHRAGFATAAFVGSVVLDRQYGLARGFDVYDDRMSPRLAAGELSYAERPADEVVGAALAWLAGARPRFFLWVHLYDPHANYAPPPGFQAAFPQNPYAGEIAFADAQLGRLLEALGARFGDEETLVAVTSDHGESLGEHGELTHSLTLYDATQLVPLVLAGPGLPRGAVERAPVALVDLAPTLLALAGAPPLPGSQGRDLREAFGRAPEASPLVYLETLAPQVNFGWSALLGLRSATLKYVRAPRPELYDLARDPGERRNLAPERPEQVAELDAVLERRAAAGRAVVRVAADAARREALEALGYLAEGAGGGRPLGQVGGRDPKDGLASVRALIRALQLLDAGRPAAALALVDRVPESGALFELTRARAALAAGEPAAAERHARAAIAADPGEVRAHVSLGRALEGLGRLAEAALSYEAARALDPAYPPAGIGLGRLAEARGERELAGRIYRDALENRGGGAAEAGWRLAALALEAGDEGESRSWLAGVPAEELERPEAALRLARAELESGHPERARERLVRARGSSPRSPALAEALAALGDGRP